MQFVRDNDWYQAIRVTGPSHNLLALKLGEPSAPGPSVERLSVSNKAPVIDADEVQRQVLEGVSQANAQLGTNYQIEAIRFVTTDTPSPTIYRFLAKAIVEQIAQGGAFDAF